MGIYVTRQFKLIPKRKWQKDYLFCLFREVTWLRNWTLADTKVRLNLNQANKIKTVQVKTGDNFEDRELVMLSSQMKQMVQQEIIENMKAIKYRKSGKGKLKFQSEHNALYLSNQSFKILPNGITFQKLRNRKFYVRGLSQIKELLQISEVKIASAVLLKRAKGFFINITFQILDKDKWIGFWSNKSFDKSLGIDFGIKTAMTFSNDLKLHYGLISNKRIKKLQKKLSNQHKGSNNRRKTKHLLKKAYEDISNIKKDIVNRIFGYCRLYKIAIQDESIKQWHKGWFGKQIQSMQHGKVIESLKQRHSNLVMIDRFVPTSQICSNCGNRKKVGLDERIYTCSKCGNKIDRDVNAAINILQEGLSIKIPVGHGELTPEERKASVRILDTSPYILISYASFESGSQSSSEVGSSQLY